MRCMYFAAVHKPGQRLRWEFLQILALPHLPTYVHHSVLPHYLRKRGAVLGGVRGGLHRLFLSFTFCDPFVSNTYNLPASVGTFLLAAFFFLS